MNTTTDTWNLNSLTDGQKTFVDAYVTCLIWQSSDDEISEMHGLANIFDFYPADQTSILRDCVEFYNAYAELWAEGWTDEQAGHDFALTRNGHGAGFWDRYYHGTLGEAGELLSAVARPYGESQPDFGDDGRLCLC